MIPARDTLIFAKHDGEEDAEKRIVAVKCHVDPDTEAIEFSAEAEAWICHVEDKKKGSDHGKFIK